MCHGGSSRDLLVDAALPVTTGETDIVTPPPTERIDDTEIFSAIVEDDDMVSEFLVVISENPEILSQKIASLMNFSRCYPYLPLKTLASRLLHLLAFFA